MLNSDPELFEPRILRHVAPSSHSQYKFPGRRAHEFCPLGNQPLWPLVVRSD